MFETTAHIYDEVYSAKDYPGECAKLIPMIRAHCPSAESLLDMACGSGRHLEFLRSEFEVEGADCDPTLLGLAAKRLPGVKLHQSDMRNFELDRQYDVITCLFSSIGYVASLSELADVCGGFAEHLKPGGVIVIEPWLTPETFTLSDTAELGLAFERDDLKVCRANHRWREGNLSKFVMHHLVATPSGVQHFVDHHELLLLTTAEMRGALEDADLRVTHDEEGLIGRGLFFATKPAPGR